MAPIGDDTVQSLQELVNKLESRVKQLEDKLQHAAGGTKHTTNEGVRMILMGPPGAGTFPFLLLLVNIVGAPANCTSQARELKHRRSRKNSLVAIWQVPPRFPHI